MSNAFVDTFRNSNEKNWMFDRNETVGASEIGKCAKQINFRKSGAEGIRSENSTYGFAVRGDILENHFLAPTVISYFKDKEGTVAENLGEDQVTIRDGYLSCTPDGKLLNAKKEDIVDFFFRNCECPHEKLNDYDDYAIEFKTYATIAIKEVPEETHVSQVQAQLVLMGLDKCLLVYCHASSLDIKTFLIERNKNITLEGLQERAESVITGDNEDLFAEGLVLGECKYCEFSHLCTGFTNVDLSGMSNSSKEDGVPVDDPAIIEFMEEYNEAEKASKKFPSLKKGLIQLAMDHGGLVYNGYKYTVDFTASRRVVNKDKLIEKLLALGGTNEDVEKCKVGTKKNLRVKKNKIR